MEHTLYRYSVSILQRITLHFVQTKRTLTGKSKIAPTRAHEQSTRAQPKIIHTRGGTPTLRASLLQLLQLSHRTDPAVWVGKADGQIPAMRSAFLSFMRGGLDSKAKKAIFNYRRNQVRLTVVSLSTSAYARGTYPPQGVQSDGRQEALTTGRLAKGSRPEHREGKGGGTCAPR